MSISKLKVIIIQIIVASSISFAADVHAPKPFKTLMTDATDKNWIPNPINLIENRAHVVFLDSNGEFCLKADEDISGSLVAGDAISLKDGTATYSDALRSMFQILDLNTATLATDDLSGTYTIHPELASYYALDIENDVLNIRDKSSFYHREQTTSAYLVFSINVSDGSNHTLQASSRYVYNVSNETYEIDTEWSGNQWVVINADLTVTLTDDAANATNWIIADARELIDVVIDPGSDFNPQSTSWQTNAFAAYPTNPNTGALTAWDYSNSALKSNQFYNNIDDDYQNQLGHSETADAAAHAILDVINQNLIELGQSMRYSVDTYITFRSALLDNNFGSIDMYNSVLGERTVEHVYFTSAYDDLGGYHPFMVIATHNAPSGPQFLIDVARPPGDNCCEGGYPEQNVTRNAVLEQKLIKIPLRDYGLVANVTDNDLTEYGTLAIDQNIPESGWNVDNHTSTSSTGVAVDGVIIYPASNNVLLYASLAAEITSTGIHVGRGMGFHYHSDGHGFSSNGLNLYNNNDYVGKSHPPIIGFVFDGIALFGKYQDSHSGMDGSSVDIDEFGGHIHDEYGYHYHSHSANVEQQSGPNTYTFTQNYLQRGAFKGIINDVPGFLNVNTNQFMDNDIKKYVGGSGTSQLNTNNTYSSSKIPSIFRIHKNYPNPFNPITTLRYDLPKDGLVNITIYDIMGRKINTLVNNRQTAGFKSTQWNATNNQGQPVAAGVYLYSIEVGQLSQTKKMVLLK
tara:strand:- start:173 stop:2398 length:2226 start_codon:yes stop_codon:yes gene_type:complete